MDAGTDRPHWRCSEPGPSIRLGLQTHYADHCLRLSDLAPDDGQLKFDAHAQSGAAPRADKHCKTTKIHGRSWQDSFDFQEFGFSYTVMEPAEVAPADELFYKGQILPLQTDTRLHVVQALSSCCMREELSKMLRYPAGRPSSMRRDDDELEVNSRGREGAMHENATSSNALGGMRSLSFRSQHSGYWESGGEKETTDTGSSSRDSNGSSQDSYIHNASSVPHINFKAKPPGLLLPWKSFFGGLMRVSRRQRSRPPSLRTVAFSEDLSKYRPVPDLCCTEVKAGLVPPIPDKSARQATEQERASSKSEFGINPLRLNGGLKGKCTPRDAAEHGASGRISDLQSSIDEDGKQKSKSGCQCVKLETSSSQSHKDGASGSISAKFSGFNKGKMAKGKCAGKLDLPVKGGVKSTAASNVDAEGREKQRKERWERYARKLKPLWEVKKGLMGQFRMDDCGKNACEVESSGIVKRSSLWQRKLSHQSSYFKNHKLRMEQEEESAEARGGDGSQYRSNHNIMQHMAMSSCPPSTRSSPNHSGVLNAVAVTADSKAKLPQTAGSHAYNPVPMRKAVSNESISLSTMQELHSAVQSAIAHCKESNRRYHLD